MTAVVAVLIVEEGEAAAAAPAITKGFDKRIVRVTVLYSGSGHDRDIAETETACSPIISCKHGHVQGTASTEEHKQPNTCTKAQKKAKSRLNRFMPIQDFVSLAVEPLELHGGA